MIKKIVCFLLINSLCVPVFAQTPPTFSSADILLQLKKLQVLGSVLYIAAHPDDENNGLLPFFAKEKLYRTAYLSITRGDGGQNLMGSEQGIELGMIRTQELLAARRIDGSEQYFTTAYEFGFSKSSQEALRIWDKEKILSDVVWVIRQYQPDIVIARFPPDARAGHGHHAASSILASEAFIAAADANKFPEQFKFGVKPWQAKRILWNTFNFGGTNTTSDDQLKIDVGGFNPLLGKSYGELGGEARSMHKSQGEGRPRRRGQVFEYFTTTGGVVPKTDLMDNVTIGWQRLEGGNTIEAMITAIIAAFNYEKPALSVPSLVKAYQAIKALPEGIWRNKKLQEVQDIIEACSGLFVDAITAQSSISQGDILRVACIVNKRNTVTATLQKFTNAGIDSTVNTNIGSNQNLQFNKNITVSSNQKISQPYWLVYPQLPGSFDVRDQTLIGKAENDAAFDVTFTIVIEGETFTIKRPVLYKVVDAAKGELYQPLVVLPKMELNYVKDNYVSLNGKPVQTQIHFKSNIKDSTLYTIHQQYSPNWTYSASNITYGTFNNTENDWIGYFIPQPATNNTSETASLVTNEGKYDGYTKRIAYDHIPTITYFPKAKTNIINVGVKIIGKKVGYIIGAGDKVPEALLEMGYNVTTLLEADLTEQNLKQFDAIVVGIRAYNIYEYLTTKYEVLMDYIKNGGHVIAQYAKSNTVGNKPIKMGPYPFIVNSGSRVTEEDAKVSYLLPNHALFNYPNKITDKDFKGWIQERSTYHAEQIDSHYEALLSMKDSGDKAEANGSLITTKFGKGNFTYVSLVLFRQLPAGVPGAYRLMANLIALGKQK
jgi:LmbE family N-acetylglucosaminyl deacetylase